MFFSWFWFSLSGNVCRSPSVPGNSGRSSRKFSRGLNFLPWIARMGRIVGRALRLPGTWERDTKYTNGHESDDRVESIGFGQFVRMRDRNRWDLRHRRQSRDGKRRASREASEFQNSCRGCRCLKGFALLVYFVGKKIIRSRSWMRSSTDKERPRKLSGRP